MGNANFTARHTDIEKHHENVQAHVINPTRKLISDLYEELTDLGQMEVGVDTKVSDTGVWLNITKPLFKGISDYEEALTHLKENIDSFMSWHEDIQRISNS